MKKVILCVLVVVFACGIALAADSTAAPEKWQTKIEASLSTAQSAYSDSWVGGEVGSIVWMANLHAVANKQLHSKVRTENDLKLAFGQTHSQSQESKNWASPVKSTDKIRFDTVEKLTLRAWVDPYIAGTFESQFYDGSFPALKRYVNPIDLSESAGIARTLLDDASGKLTTRAGFALQQHMDKVILDSAAQTTEVKTTSSSGLEWVTDWVTQFSTNLNYTTKLTLFKAFTTSQKDPLDYWKAVHMNWDNVLTAKVTKIVQVSLAWQLLYDKPISTSGRFKETLALGVSWTM
jgi:23S rRNA U2552 (ribose-2'-O)-methylase RlmE/FtsJ